MLTHFPAIERPSKESISEKLSHIKEQIQSGDYSPQNIAMLINLTDSLSESELGRFLIKNNGALSGYWTYEIILGYQNRKVEDPVEKFLVTEAPTVLATRERFFHFQKVLKSTIKSNSTVCSVPCGLMADLLTLDLPDEIHNVRFVGIDLDNTAFELSKALAEQSNTRYPIEYEQQDAWQLNLKEPCDVLTSNGLNIYEPDDEKVTDLYRQFFKNLKPGGTLVTSALTFPPGQKKPSEWNMSKINKAALERQLAIFTLLQATWANYRTSDETKFQLEKAGFENIRQVDDEQGMFPTFIANRALGYGSSL